MTHKRTRYTLAGLEIFTGSMAIYGGASLLAFESVEGYSFGLRKFQQPLMSLLALGLLSGGVFLWQRDIETVRPRGRAIRNRPSLQ